MASVPNGSIITYVGHWPQPKEGWFSFPLSSDEYLSQVQQILVGAGLSPRSGSIESSLLGGIPFTGSDVKLTLQVENGIGYGSPDDINLIVRGAVFQVAGDFPTGDSIPFVQIAGANAPVATGQPLPAPPSAKACAGSRDSAGNFDLGCWITSLTQNAMWAIGLVGIGLLVAIVLINQRKA